MPATVTLPALIALFKIDRDLQQLKSTLDNVQKSQKAQIGKIAQIQAELDSQESAHRKLQTDAASRELDMKSRQEHIEKMRAALNTKHTDKEYKAILVQISAEKAEVVKIENGLLEVMQQVETLAGAITTLKEKIAAERQALVKIEAEHSDRVISLNQQIAQHAAKRDQAAKNVPTEALRQYDRVSQRYPGDALAPLEFDESDLDSVSCGACYMGLNVEHLNALRGRDEIRRCNSCNRILYLPEMLQQA